MTLGSADVKSTSGIRAPTPREDILLAALDELAPTVVAVMILFAIVNVTIFLVPG